MAGAKPSDEFLRELLAELAPRAFRGVKVSTELVVALVQELLEYRDAGRELEREVAEIVDDVPAERRATPTRPRRRTSGPWARGAELRPEEPEELDLSVPDGD